MSKMTFLPHMVKMCDSCPFNKKSKNDWRSLNKDRVIEIINTDTFVCHKTKDKVKKQCYGHMKLFPYTNVYVKVAKHLKLDLGLQDDNRLFTLPELYKYYEINGSD